MQFKPITLTIPSITGKWQEVTDDYGHVFFQNERTKEYYSLYRPHSESVLRGICVGLAISQVAFMAIRIVARCVTLVFGDFIAGAIKLTNDQRIKNNLSNLKIVWSFGKHLVTELVKNVLKIITLPIASVALQFAALYGAVAHPLDGMYLFSLIEHTWSRHGIVASSLMETSHSLITSIFTYRLTDYLAPCLQPKSVWFEKDLFACFSIDYHQHYLENKCRYLIHEIVLLEKDLEQIAVLDVVHSILGKLNLNKHNLFVPFIDMDRKQRNEIVPFFWNWHKVYLNYFHNKANFKDHSEVLAILAGILSVKSINPKSVLMEKMLKDISEILPKKTQDKGILLEEDTTLLFQAASLIMQIFKADTSKRYEKIESSLTQYWDTLAKGNLEERQQTVDKLFSIFKGN